MAWNSSPRKNGYWSAQTRSTIMSYGPPQLQYGPPPLQYGSAPLPYGLPYGSPPSPPRSPSPPPVQTVTYEKKYYNKKNQTNGMEALTYGNGGNGNEGFFGELVPSSFPPGTDPKVMSCFQNVDRDGNGFIDEKELKLALTSYSSTFSLKTVRLIMYAFTRSNTKVVGPKEFISVYYGLQQWRAMFQKFDRDRNGKIDMSELREALRSLGYPVSEGVLDLLIVKFDKNGGNNMAIGFDGFIECCLTVKGLSDKFKENDQMLSGSATFTYETFMMTVLPYIVA